MYVKLRQFMIEKKIKSKDMANILGISKSSFSKKINQNGSDFNLNEIRIMCRKYNLDGNVYFFY